MSLEAINDSEDTCRYCYASGDKSPLCYPCGCRGSIKYVHEECLFRMLDTMPNRSSEERCQICNVAFTFSPLPTRELLIAFVWKKDHRAKVLKVLFRGIFSFLTEYMWTISIPSEIPVMTAEDCMFFFMLSFFMSFDVYEGLSNARRRRGKINLCIITAVLARPATFAFGRWIFPIFGYSMVINSTVSLFFRVGSLGLWAGWRAEKGWFDLRSSVRGRLQNDRREV